MDREFQPLAGVTVVEMTHMIMGPSCGQFLAYLGAEVIKVEPLSGDLYRGLRSTGSLAVRDSVNFAIEHANRGKQSLCMDLRREEAQAIVRRLVAEVDIVVENFGPGVMEKRGFTWDAFKAINPA